MKIRLGTRGSDLALWQARWVAERLSPEAEVELVVISTSGDRHADKSLLEMEAPGFFTSEIERSLSEGEVDLAVHSYKDLALECPEGLVIAAVTGTDDSSGNRHSQSDVLLYHKRTDGDDADHSRRFQWLPLRWGAVVGTSSPRRAAELKSFRPDLQIETLRGNVPTRVEQLRKGDMDAIVLARAGVQRLDLDVSDLGIEILAPEIFAPAPGQGFLAVQARKADSLLIDVCQRQVDCPEDRTVADGTRRLLARAGGGCHLPLGCGVGKMKDLRACRPLSDPMEQSQRTVWEKFETGWAAWGFLGADHPESGHSPRWAAARGETAEEAVDALWDIFVDGKPTGWGILGGLKVVLVGGHHRGVLASRLESLGATVEQQVVLDFEDIEAPDLSERMAALKKDDILAVTSVQAARRLEGCSIAEGVVVGAVGPTTAQALEQAGFSPSIVGSGGGKQLASLLPLPEGREGRVLFPCAEDHQPDFVDVLEERGMRHVDVIPVYRTVPRQEAEETGEAFARIYLSPSAVKAAIKLFPQWDASQDSAMITGIGLTTCHALEEAGISHERPTESSIDAVLSVLQDSDQLTLSRFIPVDHLSYQDQS